ncbi:hypothetical protein PCH_Pc21g16580 [Penicillium rubens Wisconsin 54-1255]|uniref:Uncharacterized protein n=1 Tax=Penicillium rubens (strain ATCC 28089 / DSM 1075 / NRRL 1951 / Wisconsin 54-1255) TaxID=500485 RepID=B6HLD3_PENRW|nr:hypothetical protein PCH_Pc21g16580 [Penicillium rubens Wisconsin 54-1255]
MEFEGGNSADNLSWMIFKPEKFTEIALMQARDDSPDTEWRRKRHDWWSSKGLSEIFKTPVLSETEHPCKWLYDGHSLDSVFLHGHTAKRDMLLEIIDTHDSLFWDHRDKAAFYATSVMPRDFFNGIQVLRPSHCGLIPVIFATPAKI